MNYITKKTRLWLLSPLQKTAEITILTAVPTVPHLLLSLKRKASRRRSEILKLQLLEVFLLVLQKAAAPPALNENACQTMFNDIFVSKMENKPYFAKF